MTNQQFLPSVETLRPQACWDLLRSTSVGRLAVWVDDHPDIFPVNYRVDHSSLVFRTGEGTKLRAAASDTPVALEADGVLVDANVAWSVVVKGNAEVIELTPDTLDSVGLLLFPWQAGQKDHFIRIVPTSLSGRRFAVTPPLLWWSPLSDDLRAKLERLKEETD
ncbi:pyridoxamine 5'-phosphate oxidase family protein [Arthrobacter flavus]|uniref:Pyridoxamine 5'-phosphate oxidase family protein n=1 Tax=Arthrobacter flavus TaxID=95172 RepID=A0ABW4Q7E3_9MICC